jgi:hypothetical protein
MIERNIEKISNEVVARFAIECNATQYLLAYKLSIFHSGSSSDLSVPKFYRAGAASVRRRVSQG